MSPSLAGAVRKIVAIGLAYEVVRSVSWIGRILSFAAIYDGPVFAMVALRAGVTALETSAAWILWQGLPAGSRFATWALLSSAPLVALEIGFAFAPSSVPPGQRWLMVAAYALYALVANWLLRRTNQDR